MTIKVCKEKFNTSVIKSLTVFYYIVMIGLIGSIPLGIYTIQNNLVLGSQGGSIGWLGVFIGSLAVFILVFLQPWMDDKPNLISKLNSKYKIFEWNDDC